MGALISRHHLDETSPEENKLRDKYARNWPAYADDWNELRVGMKVTVTPDEDTVDNTRAQRFLNYVWQKKVGQLARMVFQCNIQHLNFQDTYGRSALHLVCLNGSEICASILLEQVGLYPINVNLVDNQGRTALMYAVFRGRVRMIKRLIAKGADTTVRDFRGLNCLMIAATAPSLYYMDLVTRKEQALRAKDLRGKLVSSKRLAIGKWGALKNVVTVKNVKATAKIAAKRISMSTNTILLRRDSQGRMERNHRTNGCGSVHVRYPHVFAPNSIEVRVLNALIDSPGKTPLLIDAPDNVGMSALSLACKFGHILAVSRLLMVDASLEHRDSTRMTPLHHAVQAEHHDVIEFLIEHRADVNAASMYFESGFHMAINNGDQESWEILLKNSADIEAADYCGQTPILLALKMKRRVLFERLIEKGASLDVVNTRGWNVIIQAIHSGLGSSLHVIFNRTPDDASRKAILRWTDPQGRTALHHAISPKLINDAKLILSLDEHVTIPDCNGMTPLHLAAECNVVEIMNDICRCASNLDITNNWGETPLHAAANSGSVACALSLLSIKKNLCPADCSRTDHLRRTVLMHACIGGNADFVKLLLLNKEGLNRNLGFVDPCINAQDIRGQTALMHAAMNGHWEIISTLILGLADITLIDTDGFNALHHAAAEGENYCCMTLADLGVPNYVDYRGNTPLHCAVENREVQVCQTLLDREADVHARNYNEETPLGIAVNIRCPGISEILCKHIQESDISHESSRGAKVTALGKFMVTIKECNGLVISDLDTTNPYIMIQFKSTALSDTPMVVTSCVLGKNQHPTWNETFEFDSEYIDHTASLVITVLRLPDDETQLLFGQENDEAAGSGPSTLTMFGQIIPKQTQGQDLQKKVKADDLEFLGKSDNSTRDHDRIEQAWGIFNLVKAKIDYPDPPVPKSHLPFGFAGVKFAQLRSAVHSCEPRQFNLPLRGGTTGGRVVFEIDFRPRLWKCVDVANKSSLERRLRTPRSEDVDDTM
eukprot:GEMP01007356.1.p1 GENE.GEMP01007356.1~~GEMP01007356.1.p1  ORF type:complete len:1003 (-),score=129.07 GEMP01007356.1:580-3588(-)